MGQAAAQHRHAGVVRVPSPEPAQALTLLHALGICGGRGGDDAGCPGESGEQDLRICVSRRLCSGLSSTEGFGGGQGSRRVQQQLPLLSVLVQVL